MLTSRVGSLPWNRQKHWQVAICVLAILTVVCLLFTINIVGLAILLVFVFCIEISIISPKTLKKTLFLSFFLIPFIMVTPMFNPLELNYTAYYAILAGFSALFFVSRAKGINIDAITVYLLWIAINGLIYIGGITKIVENYSLFIFPLIALSLYFILVNRTEDKEKIYFIKVMMLFVVLESLIGISQSFLGVPIFSVVREEGFQSYRNYFGYMFPTLSTLVSQGTGTFAHFNGLGALLALTFPIFLGFWWTNRSSTFRFFLMVTVLLGIFTTYSRGALLGTTVGSFFLFAYKSKSVAYRYCMVLILFLLLLVAFTDAFRLYYEKTGNLLVRFAAWRLAITYAFDSPENLLFGYGYTFFRSEILEEVISNLHSGPLQILLELGLFGFILFIAFFIKIIYKVLKSNRNLMTLSLLAGLISFFTHQLFDNAMFGVTNGGLMICIFAILKHITKNKSPLLMEWWVGKGGVNSCP